MCVEKLIVVVMVVKPVEYKLMLSNYILALLKYILRLADKQTSAYSM